MPTSVSLTVNGQAAMVTVDDPGQPLLYVLRNDLELRGPRFGCGLGQCGACAVLLDGDVVLSCKTPLSKAAQSNVVTLEGLGSLEKPSPVQQAFIDEQAAQCGFCINGMIIQATALLAKTKNPSVAEIKKALADNLCRCGTHLRIIRAVQRAAQNI
jgi:nicotinate dehydrogenase subunit A